MKYKLYNSYSVDLIVVDIMLHFKLIENVVADVPSMRLKLFDAEAGVLSMWLN